MVARVWFSALDLDLLAWPRWPGACPRCSGVRPAHGRVELVGRDELRAVADDVVLVSRWKSSLAFRRLLVADQLTVGRLKVVDASWSSTNSAPHLVRRRCACGCRPRRWTSFSIIWRQPGESGVPSAAPSAGGDDQRSSGLVDQMESTSSSGEIVPAPPVRQRVRHVVAR